MKKYLVVLADGTKQLAYSSGTYKVGDFIGIHAMVLVVYNI